MPSKKKLLYEVSIIRPIVILLLVLLHSFTKIESGGGGQNDYQLANGYQWFCWLISGFRIETIALVAGYVFAYQCIDLQRSYEFWPFVVKKFKRLIVPMLVFGLCYYFCFYFRPDVFELKSFIITLLSGCGHLWFLPMLFWCFVLIWIIDKFNLSSWFTFILLAVISILPLPSLPLGFSRLPHFVFYVYFGYFLWQNKGFLITKCLRNSSIIFLWVLYVLLVLTTHLIIPDTTLSMTIIQKAIVKSLSGFTRLLMSSCGILALYLTVCKIIGSEGYYPKQWIIDLSDDCYGVYVYHQFVLVFLYFYTSIVYVCPPLLVPWIGFIVTISVSLLLTKLTLKTRIGKLLIG